MLRKALAEIRDNLENDKSWPYPRDTKIGALKELNHLIGALKAYRKQLEDTTD